MDSVPLVCITGQVVSWLIGRDGFQEADITGITIPITKHNELVLDVEGHRRARCRRRSTSPRPGGPARCSSTSRATCSSRPCEFEYPGRQGRTCAATSRRLTADPQRGREARRELIAESEQAADPRRPRRRHLARLRRAGGAGGEGATSPSSRRCSASAASPARTRCTWACPACTACTGTTSRSARPT